MTKAEIRNMQKELRKGLSIEELEYRSNCIWERLINTIAYQNCTNLFTFVSLADEVNTHSIIIDSINRKKRVYVPRVEARRMEFYQITNLDHLTLSKFGILEPEGCDENRFVIDYNPNILNEGKDPEKQYQNLLLLPGLAFDLKGNRIGYGAGYYDKYLASYPEDTFYKIALAFEFQLMEEIPSEEYDRKADAIITPKELMYINVEGTSSKRFLI